MKAPAWFRWLWRLGRPQPPGWPPRREYEWRDVAESDAHRASGGVYVLLRANIRTQVLAAVENHGEQFELAQVLAGLNLAL